ALTVVLAAKGYPGNYDKGSSIAGIDKAEAMGAMVFHAGTAMKGETVIANGGRVLNVTAMGRNAKEAQARAYAAVDAIDWPEGFCRRDIGWRAV
ncbi:MAG: phosphoribosylamine--glycine ligase, partial [Nitratireductor sp.]|nr:phosphoribosylamine--glycine ligase [Nitratireductor sp.]